MTPPPRASDVITASSLARLVRRFGWGLWITSLALACGDAGDSSESAPPSGTETETMTALADRLCSRLATLGCITDPTFSGSAGAHGVSCRENYESTIAEAIVAQCGAQAATVLACLEANLRCPDSPPQSLRAEALVDAFMPACSELAGLDACMAAAPSYSPVLDCTPLPSASDRVADYDWDGVPEALTNDVVDRRLECVTSNVTEHITVDIPAILLPANSEKLTCLNGTYTGPDIAVVGMAYASDPATNHHLIVSAMGPADLTDFPDGQPYDCTNIQRPMADPLFHGVTEPGVGRMLRSGQRYYTELHGLNLHSYPVLISAKFVLRLTPLDEVTALSAAYLFGPTEVQVPPGIHHIKSECVWTKDASVLSVVPHMHLHGLRYALDYTNAEGTERLLAVDPWLDEYFEMAAPQRSWRLNEFKVKAGDVFTTHCTWNNPLGHTIRNPEEMCNTEGAVVPSDAAMNCSGTTTVVVD
ncbi:MAG: hypothetical protein IV100_21695 [Myxococcales bacterium]|nr:hypothetical protein [Myxococcales bacterium]